MLNEEISKFSASSLYYQQHQNKLASLLESLAEQVEANLDHAKFSGTIFVIIAVESINVLVDEYFLIIPSSCCVFDPLMQKASQLIKAVLMKNVLELSLAQNTETPSTSASSFCSPFSSSHRDDNVFDALRLLSALRRTEVLEPKTIISLLLTWLSSPGCSERTGLSILKIFVDWHKTLFSKVQHELETTPVPQAQIPPSAAPSSVTLSQLISFFLSFVKDLFSWIHSHSMGSSSASHCIPSHQPSASNSLKVATECPLIIVVLFQIYKKPMADLFVNGPLMMQFVEFSRTTLLDRQLTTLDDSSLPLEVISIHVKVLLFR